MRFALGFTFAVATFAAACSSTTTTPADDASPSDTSPADTSIADSSTVDSSTVDSSTDTTIVDSSTDVASETGTPCGTLTCKSGEICTRTYTTGGACMTCGDDGGGCPSGYHCSGSCCVVDAIAYAYACKPLPSCGATPTCSSCGSAVCGSGGCPCESITGNVATCHCMAP